ncbi:transient receptor potential cation channel subfamily A member 1-like [Planococcus citri]|uniref:transient receptor potential cation channel subfamily A member 1-like n=1 Tax=Planococcus citri TaxID=170843 RepID=UPI0031F87AF9
MAGYWTLKSLLKQQNFEKFAKELEKNLQFGQLDINYPNECPALVALLHIACQSKGCHKFVEILLQKGADINHPSDEEFSRAAIHFAVENGDVETLKILLNDPNCNVNTLSKHGYSALHYAVERDDVDCIMLLLQHSGIDINIVGDANQTPLHLALNNNCRKAIYELLEHREIDLDRLGDNSGHTCRQLINSKYPEFALKLSQIGSLKDESDSLFSLLYKREIDKFREQVMICAPNSNDHNGEYTYLQYACHYGLVEVVEILLNAEVDPNQYCPNNPITPIMITIERGYHSILKLLLEEPMLSFEPVAQKNVFHILIDGMHAVKNSPVNENLESDHIKCLQYLLNSKFCSQWDINHPNEEGYSPLHRAIKLNDKELINVLLHADVQFNLDINLPDNEGNTPLHYAVILRNEEIIRALVGAGSILNLDLNHPDSKGCIPLHSAIRMGYEEITKALLDAGSNFNLDINWPNSNGDTPLHYAVYWQNEDIIKVLLDAGPNFNLDINLANNYGDTPLQYAIHGQHEEIVKILLDAGSNFGLDINHQNNEGFAAFHCAVSLGNKEIIKSILDAGSNFNLDINLQSNKGNTPLHHAIHGQNEENIEVLLDAGSNFNLNINQPNDNGYTPLHYAICCENEEIVKVLLASRDKYGLDISYPNNDGYTPLYCAVIYGNEGIINALLHAGAHVVQRAHHGITLLQLTPGSVLKEYLDKCISTSKNAPTLLQHEIIFDYSMITHPKRESSAAGSISYVTEMEALQIMARTAELRDVLKHPVLLSFLSLRWYTIAKYFYIYLIFHIIYFILLTTYICCTNCSSSGHYNTVSHNFFNCSEYLNSAQLLNDTSVNCSDYPNSIRLPNDTSNNADNFVTGGDHISQVDVCLWYVMMVLCIIFAFKELYQFHVSPRKYLRSAENWLEICLICLTLVLLLRQINFECQHKLSSIVIIVAGMDLMLLIGRHPLSSSYIEMFKAVSISFLKLLACYLILIISFALSFYMLFKDEPQNNDLFKEPALSFLKSIVMLTGELGTDDIPLRTFDLNSSIGYFLFILFIFLIAIVLYNLLNGLAVSDTQAIKSDAELVVTVSKVKLISYVEGIVIPHFFKCLNFICRITKFCTSAFCGENGCRHNRYIVYKSINSLRYTFPENKIYVRPNMDNIVRLPKHNSTDEISRIAIDSHIVKQAKKILEKNKQLEKDAEERNSQKREYNSKMENIEKLLQEHNNKLKAVEKLSLEYNNKLETVEKLSLEYNNKLETVDKSLKEIMKILKPK